MNRKQRRAEKKYSPTTTTRIRHLADQAAERCLHSVKINSDDELTAHWRRVLGESIFREGSKEMRDPFEALRLSLLGCPPDVLESLGLTPPASDVLERALVDFEREVQGFQAKR